MRTTLLLLLAGSALAGCARSVEIVRREPGPTGGATGRGAEVVFAGAQGGFGNLVVLRHDAARPPASALGPLLEALTSGDVLYGR